MGYGNGNDNGNEVPSRRAGRDSLTRSRPASRDAPDLSRGERWATATARFFFASLIRMTAKANVKGAPQDKEKWFGR